MRSSLIGLVVLTILITSCGGAETQEASAQDLAEKIQSADDAVAINAEQASCTAENLVNKIDDSKLASIGLSENTDSSEDLTNDDKEILEEAYLACTDLTQYFVDSYSHLGLEESVSRCLADALDEEALQEFAALSLSKTKDDVSADLQGKLDVASTDCLA